MKDDAIELIDDAELLLTYPQSHAKEAFLLLRRIQFLKLHKSDVSEYDKNALCDVESLQDVLVQLMYVHSIEVEEFVENNFVNKRVVDFYDDEIRL